MLTLGGRGLWGYDVAELSGLGEDPCADKIVFGQNTHVPNDPARCAEKKAAETASGLVNSVTGGGSSGARTGSLDKPMRNPKQEAEYAPIKNALKNFRDMPSRQATWKADTREGFDLMVKAVAEFDRGQIGYARQLVRQADALRAEAVAAKTRRVGGNTPNPNLPTPGLDPTAATILGHPWWWVVIGVAGVAAGGYYFLRKRRKSQS